MHNDIERVLISEEELETLGTQLQEELELLQEE